MKNTLFIILLLFLAIPAFTQNISDSAAYQLQRQKINNMLADRARKFGDYDQSLNMHTGIFGFQTKKDIRHSNDILMDIVKTDDSIYRQIKILLEYRTFQQQQVQNKSDEFESTRIGYMTTINKLRNQLDELKANAAKQQDAYDQVKRNLIIALIAGGVLLVLVLKNLAQPKTKWKPITRKRK